MNKNTIKTKWGVKWESKQRHSSIYTDMGIGIIGWGEVTNTHKWQCWDGCGRARAAPRYQTVQQPHRTGKGGQKGQNNQDVKKKPPVTHLRSWPRRQDRKTNTSHAVEPSDCSATFSGKQGRAVKRPPGCWEVLVLMCSLNNQRSQIK